MHSNSKLSISLTLKRGFVLYFSFGSDCKTTSANDPAQSRRPLRHHLHGRRYSHTRSCLEAELGPHPPEMQHHQQGRTWNSILFRYPGNFTFKIFLVSITLLVFLFDLRKKTKAPTPVKLSTFADQFLQYLIPFWWSIRHRAFVQRGRLTRKPEVRMNAFLASVSELLLSADLLISSPIR